ncbi:bacteriocin [Prolixibacter sp. SD074]|jgi:bacteriocin-like protein|uniref:bacteriocin n=1 Tax=Prolixibacter sp. SD074 TaxID=2652391 RepID=UPI001276F9B5|nr:bacteriocin [Prolixibacter sp. SD074]GET29909.1 hypothetical protein SD074_21110 [Prolixibacter sp. SD074]
MKELSKNELRKIDGGGIGTVIRQVLKKVPGPVGWGAAAAFYLWDNWDDVSEGWNSYDAQHM